MRATRFASVVAVSIACARPPDGRVELEASRQAMQKVTRFTMESTSTTEIGTFHHTFEVDCARGYYHKLYVADLTPKGVEGRTSQLQGRPRAHTESEELYVDGHSYVRSSEIWENSPPEYDNTRPGWHLHHSSFAERADCNRIRQEPDLLNVPYSKIAKSNSVEYVGRRSVNGTKCNEFRVVYEDMVWGDRMITRDHGNGSVSSEREMVKQSLEARICIGETDRLAYRSEQTDERRVPITREISYGEFTPLSAPAVTQ